MTGKVTGVATRQSNTCPNMIVVHCVNHRLALAAAQASDSVPYVLKFKSILQTLLYFFQNSPVRMANLHAIQEILNDPVIKCKQAKDVRWLSDDNAIRALCVHFHLSLSALKEKQQKIGNLLHMGYINSWLIMNIVRVYI